MGICLAVPNASQHDDSKRKLVSVSGKQSTLHDGAYSMHVYAILGEGGFGKVIRARNKKSDERLAVKCVSKILGDKIVRDAKREAKLLKGLNHANVINIVDGYDTPTQYHIVMELCSGGDLYDRLMDAPHFTECDCKNLSRQILNAVAYIHQQGVCHRDVKLENFAFSRVGPIGDNDLKLLDFGLAIELNILATDISECCGTPDYAAPEMLRRERCGPLVDEWGCGCVIYAMLSGRLPFEGDSDIEIVRAVLSGVYTLSNQDWQGISNSAKMFVRGLLWMHASDRLSAQAGLRHAWLANRR